MGVRASLYYSFILHFWIWKAQLIELTNQRAGKETEESGK